MSARNEPPAEQETGNAGRITTHLKLAVSIQAQPNFTTHLATSSSAVPAGDGELEVHGVVLSGSRKPLSRANCSRQMGRKRVRETIANASLANA